MAYASREQENAYKREHYKRNKQKYLDTNSRRRAELREIFRALKNQPCMDCHQTYPYYVMDFDHRPGTVKLYNPYQLAARGGRHKMREELAKCDLVCSNCHRIRTHDRLERDKNGIKETGEGS